jgi:hypothetical protein
MKIQINRNARSVENLTMEGKFNLKIGIGRGALHWRDTNFYYI